MGPLLRPAPEVWEHFVACGGLQPDAWDAPLVDELGARLGLGDGDVAASSAAHGITAERLIHALLGTLASFLASSASSSRSSVSSLASIGEILGKHALKATA